MSAFGVRIGPFLTFAFGTRVLFEWRESPSTWQVKLSAVLFLGSPLKLSLGTLLEAVGWPIIPQQFQSTLDHVTCSGVVGQLFQLPIPNSKS
jgi:hypothetical protein